MRACLAEDALASLTPYQVKRVRVEQAEALENEKVMTPAEQKKRRRTKQRHTQLKIIAGSAAGVTRRCMCGHSCGHADMGSGRIGGVARDASSTRRVPHSVVCLTLALAEAA